MAAAASPYSHSPTHIHTHKHTGPHRALSTGSREKQLLIPVQSSGNIARFKHRPPQRPRPNLAQWLRHRYSHPPLRKAPLSSFSRSASTSREIAQAASAKTVGTRTVNLSENSSLSGVQWSPPPRGTALELSEGFWVDGCPLPRASHPGVCQGRCKPISSVWL